MERYREDKEESLSALCIDSQNVKISSFIGLDTGYDGGKKIKGRKRHIAADTMGLIRGVVVSSAQVYDGNEGMKAFGQLKEQLVRLKKVFADGSYNAHTVGEALS
ncbi:MAG: transposase [Saprospiraceae bacterium]